VATDLQTRDSLLLVTSPTPDPRSALLLNTYLDSDRLIGFVQPTVWSDYGLKTARAALEAAQAALTNARYLADLSTPHRLQRAIAAANDTVIAANRNRTGHEHDARVGVGIALCLRSGRTATTALVPPVQLLLFQGRSPTWYPRRESWTGSDAGLNGSPLGWNSNVSPTFIATVVEHGDEILLTTGPVGATLARSESGFKSAAQVCDQISLIADPVDPIEIVALSTRFEPASLGGSIRSATNQVIGHVDRRARAVWSAIRTPA
jgi:hypothetical protein